MVVVPGHSLKSHTPFGVAWWLDINSSRLLFVLVERDMCLPKKNKNTPKFISNVGHTYFSNVVYFKTLFSNTSDWTELHSLCSAKHPASQTFPVCLCFFTEKNHQEFAMEHPCLFHIAFCIQQSSATTLHTGFRNLNRMLFGFLLRLAEFSFLSVTA